MKSFTLKILVVSASIFSFSLTNAIAQETFEEWKKKQMEEYEAFKEERDRKFMKYLNSAWKAVGAEKAIKQYEEPKPESLPEADPNPKDANLNPGGNDEQQSTVRVNIPKTSTGDRVTSERNAKADRGNLSKISPEEQKSEEALELETARTEFYRVPLAFRFDPQMDFTIGDEVNKKSISNYWKTMSSSQYSSTLERALAAIAQLQLNDWGFTRLLYQIGGEIYGESHNERVLFTWFMLSKADYTAKVGYNKDNIFLLTPSQNQLYNTDYFRLGEDREKYYVFVFNEAEPKPQNVRTYEGNYPDADTKMNYHVKDAPFLEQDSLTKTLTFSYAGEDYSFDVSINDNLISYYTMYPQADLEVYFSADVTPEIRTGLLGNLRPLIDGKSEYEAVNMILRFVQTAFEYQVDHEQFGKEKYLFPAETLFYPASDCEDRTILFAYLVRQLTGLDVIGLRYPSHISTAVRFTEPPEGDNIDSISVDGTTYTVADPTYKWADVGMSMPKHKDKQPTVLKLDG